MVALHVTFASAGVGLKWQEESKIVNQGQKSCFQYSVYNPWPQQSYATIKVSEELQSIIQSQDAEVKLIPANTPSTAAIPVKFCFEVPFVYEDERNCWLGDRFVCSQTCNAPQKIYDGEVLVSEADEATAISGGAGGSATSLSVSGPLRIRVNCIAHGTDFTKIYLIVAVLSAIGIVGMMIKRHRMPVVERDKERLRRLQEKITKESKDK